MSETARPHVTAAARSGRAAWFLTAVLVCAGMIFPPVGAPAASRQVVLITPEEALLPVPQSLPPSRAITRGPRIDISDIRAEKLHSPLRFRLKFKSFGGSTLDLSTLNVTYLRGTNIDLTKRVLPFARSDGIDIPDAEVPSGEHAIRVEISDSDGRVASTNFVLSILPN